MCDNDILWQAYIIQDIKTASHPLTLNTAIVLASYEAVVYDYS